MLRLDRAPRIITFDCYGTLVRWHEALEDAARSISSAHQPNDDPSGLATTLAHAVRSVASAEQQRRPYRRYATVLRASLERALSNVGYGVTEADHQTLWAHLSKIPSHPDTIAALGRLRTRYQLAIISNTDDDLIAATVANLGVAMDFVVTAQQAEAYKPDHALFEYAHAAMGVTKEETVHVAMGQFADLKVCSELGIRSVWINRKDEQLDPQWSPDAVLRDLSGLPDLLLGPKTDRSPA